MFHRFLFGFVSGLRSSSRFCALHGFFECVCEGLSGVKVQVSGVLGSFGLTYLWQIRGVGLRAERVV